ncbi:MAG: hypothetical protein E7170_00370 [Firmicutes bacterium]|nr:hypothetical protein [Bacillota bacterium]
MNYENKKRTYYPVDKLFYADVDGVECIACEMYNNHNQIFKQLINLSDYSLINKKIYDFKFIKSLKEEIKAKKMEVCLYTRNGEDKKNIAIEDVINIIKISKMLDEDNFDNINELCYIMTNKISDLLGINIESNPSSNLKIEDIEEICVPAIKVEKFKTSLFNSIKISLILDGNVEIYNDDYRVLNALKKSNIKNNGIENEFFISVDRKGQEELNCDYIVKNNKHIKSYQKINMQKSA